MLVQSLVAIDAKGHYCSRQALIKTMLLFFLVCLCLCLLAIVTEDDPNFNDVISVESSVLDFCVSGETVVEIYLQLVDVIVDKFGEKDY